MITIIDRIKQIMEYYQLAPASFAEQIGINRSNLTHLFSGRNQPSLDLAKKILHSYPEIKTEWLIMGVGEMMRSNEEKELNIKIQNEKKSYIEQNEPDLFTLETVHDKKEEMPPPPQFSSDAISVEAHGVAHPYKVNEKICNPREVEKKEVAVTKIVFFYSDNSFEVFFKK